MYIHLFPPRSVVHNVCMFGFTDYGSDDYLSASTSLLSSAMGYAAGKDQADAAEYAADKNLEATNATNEAQLQLYREQREYDYAKWKELLDYTTPSNQAARYRAAGINPALALSNISSGNVNSTAGGQSVPSLQVPTIDTNAFASAHAAPLQGLLNGFSQGTNALLTHKQIIAQNTENLKNLAALDDDIKGRHEDTRTKKLLNDVTDATLEDTIQTQKEQRRQAQLQTSAQALLVVGSEYDVGMKRFDFLNLKPLEQKTIEQGLAHSAAQISLMAKQGKLTLQQIDESINRVAQSWAQIGIAKYNAVTQRNDSLNQQWNRNQATYRDNKLFPLLKQQLKLGVDVLNKQNDSYWLDKTLGYTSTVLGTVAKYAPK